MMASRGPVGIVMHKMHLRRYIQTFFDYLTRWSFQLEPHIALEFIYLRDECRIEATFTHDVPFAMVDDALCIRLKCHREHAERQSPVVGHCKSFKRQAQIVSLWILFIQRIWWARFSRLTKYRVQFYMLMTSRPVIASRQCQEKNWKWREVFELITCYIYSTQLIFSSYHTSTLLEIGFHVATGSEQARKMRCSSRLKRHLAPFFCEVFVSLFRRIYKSGKWCNVVH